MNNTNNFLNNMFDVSNAQVNENLFMTPIFSSMIRNINRNTNLLNTNIDISDNITDTTPLLNELPRENFNNNFLNILSNLLNNNNNNNTQNINEILNRTLNEKATYKKVLDKKGLEQIKTIIYNPDEYPDDKHCPISFINFKQGDEINKLPCGHIFHKESICKWLEKEQAKCPVCRYELSSKEVKNEDISQNIIYSRPRPSFTRLFQDMIIEREERRDEEALQRAILESLNIN